jgi:hypothetical protein
MIEISNQSFVLNVMKRIHLPLACCNCGRMHNSTQGPRISDCYLITIKRSGRSKLCVFDNVHSISIPTSPEERRKLRNLIWEEFESIKVENDLDREDFATQQSQKGQLRSKAPIPWLSWTSVDGRHGKTRNKANFFAVWENTIEKAVETRPTWLSSVLVQSDMFDGSDSLLSRSSE